MLWIVRYDTEINEILTYDERKGLQYLSGRLTKGSVLMSIKGSELGAMEKVNKFKDIPHYIA